MLLQHFKNVDLALVPAKSFMHIIHIASELAPIAKAGGLADVVYGLCQETLKLKYTTGVILPKYDCIDYKQLSDLKVEQKDIWILAGSNRYNNTIWSANLGKVKIFLIESDHPERLYNRGVIYGCSDDIDRFIYFSCVAMQFLLQLEKQPDILHLHDWHTSLIALLCQKNNCKLKSVLTIHNLAHQGTCSISTLFKLGKDLLKDLDFSDSLNLLETGIIYADCVAIVSPNYQKEIQTPEGGCGLDGVLREYQKKLVSILNGIDQDYWNPTKDPYLKRNYPINELESVLKAKLENKYYLQKHLFLTQENVPLISCITRLVPQKGPDLIEYGMIRTLELGGQFVLLGSVSQSNNHIEEQFASLQEKYRNDNRIAILLINDEKLAHLIFAASDLFIIPSLFEPCGLTQMIAMRYGTIPIARMTGGLVDTVFDIDTSNKPFEKRNGFTFAFADQQGVNWALERAITCYKNHKKWQQIIKAGLNYDSSWKKSTKQYLCIYEELLTLKT
ncbi:MAG: glycogen synthase [Candidatus Rhabdochlamydia sp.]|jgi:starch synthase|nr:starch synthase [Chlamydiota bacterium]